MDRDIQAELGKLKRATLAPDRKAALRAQLESYATVESESTRNRRRGVAKFRGMSVTAISVASVLVLAGLGVWQYHSLQGTDSGTSTVRGSGVNAHPSGVVAPQKSIPVVLDSFQMTSATDGWAISQDGKLLKSLEGGTHWTDETPNKKPFQPKQVIPFYLDVNHAWLVEPATGATQSAAQGASQSATIFRTGNGGETWNQASVPLGAPTMAIDHVQFVDANHGWVMERSTNGTRRHVEIYRTTDGGGTWQQVIVADPSNPSDFMAWEQKVTFVDVNTGWALLDSPVGGSFTFARTTDGGVHWQQMTKIDVPVPTAFKGYTGAYDYLPTFFGNKGVWPIEYRNIDGGKPLDTYVIVYKTNDGGATWQASAPHRSSEPEPRFYFTSLDVGWSLITTGQVEQTTDGGEHWNKFSPNWQFGYLSWNFVNATQGWSKDVDSRKAQTTVLHTQDGGRTWTLMTTSMYQ